MLYLLVFLYLLVNVYLYDLNDFKSQYKKVNIIISFILLALITAFRYRMASDSLAYQYFVEVEVRDLGDLDLYYLFNARFDSLWVLLSSISKGLGSYLYLQVFVSFFTIMTICILTIKNTKYVSTVALFFFVTFYHYYSMEILRESLAVAFFIWSVMLFEKNKISSFVMCVLAILCHKFAVITLLLYFWFYIGINYKKTVWVLFFCVFIISVLDNPLGKIDSLLSNIKHTNLSMYNIKGDISISGKIYFLLKCCIVVYFINYYYKVKSRVSFNIGENILITLSLIYVAVFVIRITSIPYIERIANYFVIFVILFCCSLLIDKLRVQQALIRNIIFLPIVLVICAYSWLPLMKYGGDRNIPEYSRYYPYSSIFFKKKDPLREELILLESKELPYIGVN